MRTIHSTGVPVSFRRAALALLTVAAVVAGTSQVALATHERATQIGWNPLGGNTVEFEIQGSWRRSADITGNGRCRNLQNPRLPSARCTGPRNQAGVGAVIESLCGFRMQERSGYASRLVQ